MATGSTLRACAAGALFLAMAACGATTPIKEAPKPGEEPQQEQLEETSEVAPNQPSADDSGELQGGQNPRAHDRLADAPRPAPTRGPQGPAPVWLSAPMPAYQPGEVLKHMKSCSDAFVYMNVAALIGSEAGSVRKAIAAAAQMGGSKAKKIFELADKSFTEAGVDPIASVKELGFCEDGSPEVLVVGIAPANPIEVPVLLEKVLSSAGESVGSVERNGEISQLFDTSGGMAQVSPTILLFGDKDDVLAAVKAGAPDPKYKDAAKHVLHGAGDDVSVVIDDKAGTLSLRLEGPAKNKTAAEIDQKLKQVADHLAKTKLKVLGDRIRAAKTSVSGKKIVITGTITRAQITSLLQTAASLSAADVDQLMKGM
jgi:hypothetical protein